MEQINAEGVLSSGSINYAYCKVLNISSRLINFLLLQCMASSFLLLSFRCGFK